MVIVKRKSTKELLWDEITTIDEKEQNFSSAVKWCRAIVKFIKRKDNTRYEIEKCLETLDRLIYDCLVKFATFGDEDGNPLSEKDRSSYVEIILIVEDIKLKYDKKEKYQEQETKLEKRLDELSKRVKQ